MKITIEANSMEELQELGASLRQHELPMKINVVQTPKKPKYAPSKPAKKKHIKSIYARRINNAPAGMLHKSNRIAYENYLHMPLSQFVREHEGVDQAKMIELVVSKLPVQTQAVKMRVKAAIWWGMQNAKKKPTKPKAIGIEKTEASYEPTDQERVDGLDVIG